MDVNERLDELYGAIDYAVSVGEMDDKHYKTVDAIRTHIEAQDAVIAELVEYHRDFLKAYKVIDENKAIEPKFRPLLYVCSLDAKAAVAKESERDK